MLATSVYRTEIERLADAIIPCPKLSDLRALTRHGRIFAVLTGYLDDSHGKNTVAVGGWIGRDDIWDLILAKWDQRIAHENRISLQSGLRSLKRYKASDCALRVKDFEGWTLERQIRFTKRLVEIMTSHKPALKPMVFAHGMSLIDARALPDPITQLGVVTEEMLLDGTYYMCVRTCLEEIANVMFEYHTNERITFIHDSGTQFNTARDAFNRVKNSGIKGSGQFVTFTPMDWQDCHLLQTADMIAYDSYKVIDKKLHHDPDAVRKSLEALVGQDTPIIFSYIKPGGLRELYEEWEAAGYPEPDVP
jgi:hypothetical protein